MWQCFSNECILTTWSFLKMWVLTNQFFDPGRFRYVDHLSHFQLNPLVFSLWDTLHQIFAAYLWKLRKVPEIQSTKQFDTVGLGWSHGICILRTLACLFSFTEVENHWPYFKMSRVVVEIFYGIWEFKEGLKVIQHGRQDLYSQHKQHNILCK